MTMPRPAPLAAFACALMLGLAPPAPADDEPTPDPPVTLAEALRRGDFGVALRYRFEHVDQDGVGDTAEASTLRTALSYRSAPFHKWNGWADQFLVTPSVGLDTLYLTLRGTFFLYSTYRF